MRSERATGGCQKGGSCRETRACYWEVDCLATLLTVWALSELSSLPGSVYSFLHYADGVSVMSGTAQYLRHHYLISLGFFGCPDRRILFAGDMAVSVWLRCRGVPASDGSPGGERELK